MTRRTSLGVAVTSALLAGLLVFGSANAHGALHGAHPAIPEAVTDVETWSPPSSHNLDEILVYVEHLSRHRSGDFHETQLRLIPELVLIGETPEIDAFERAVETAQLTLRTYGRFDAAEGTIDREAGPLRQAIATLVDRYDVSGSRLEFDRSRLFDWVPSRLGSAVAQVIHAFVDLDETTQATIPADPPATAPRFSLPKTLSPTDAAPILAAKHRFLSAVRDLRGEAGDLAEADRNRLQEEWSQPIVIAPAISLDLGGVDHTHTSDVALSISLGGDDRYLNNAGGNNFLGQSCDALTERPAGAAALVDLGEGSDEYGSRDAPRGCGVNGGGFQGSGLLIDDGGDDLFVAGGTSTNGGGGGGGGLLISVGGDDRFEAGSFGTNGGTNGGYGFLINGGGDNTYIGGGYGTNGGGYGGSGFLLDMSGNDTYVAGDNGTNGGGFIGAGTLVDLGGNDTYTAGSGGTNGGAQVGSGFLFAAGGNDSYTAGSFGTNGGAWQGGVGLLLGMSGDDVYTAGGGGTNGGGGMNGTGMLIDVSGDDIYVAGSGGANGGASSASTGLLLDLDGMDSYEDEEGGTGVDRTVFPKGAVGAQIDWPNPP